MNAPTPLVRNLVSSFLWALPLVSWQIHRSTFRVLDPISRLLLITNLEHLTATVCLLI